MAIAIANAFVSSKFLVSLLFNSGFDRIHRKQVYEPEITIAALLKFYNTLKTNFLTP